MKIELRYCADYLIMAIPLSCELSPVTIQHSSRRVLFFGSSVAKIVEVSKEICLRKYCNSILQFVRLCEEMLVEKAVGVPLSFVALETKIAYIRSYFLDIMLNSDLWALLSST